MYNLLYDDHKKSNQSFLVVFIKNVVADNKQSKSFEFDRGVDFPNGLAKLRTNTISLIDSKTL